MRYFNEASLKIWWDFGGGVPAGIPLKIVDIRPTSNPDHLEIIVECDDGAHLMADWHIPSKIASWV